MRAAAAVTNLLGRVRRALTPAPLTLLEMTTTSFLVANGILAIAKLGVADTLVDGPKTAEEIARILDAHPEPLGRVLRALSNAGVFELGADGRFGLNALSRCMVTDAPGSMRSVLVMASEPWHFRLWSTLHDTIKTGRPAHELALGMPLFDYFEKNPESSHAFNRAMIDYATTIADAAVASYDFSGVGRLVDVGGGYGHVVARFLDAHPTLRATVVDLPHVVSGAREVLEQAGVSDRVDLVGGSFFEELPAGGDVYMLANILHDWDDEKAVAILKSCRKAMSDKARLLVVEMVVPAGNTPYFGAIFDMQMLVMFHGGKERTEAQFRALFEAAGLKLNRLVPTFTASYVMEAVPV